MLSIGIVASGGIGYYMSAVGSGVDDYYARTDPGRWMGAAAADLGLAGAVEAKQVDALAAGLRPDTGGRLGVRVGKVVAFDLTFSAPKSVSVMAELADPTTRDQVVGAHRAAVEATLRFIETEGVLVGRRGLGGTHQVLTTGALAAGFEHRTSRAGDPQLHTHLLVFNRARAIDGRWGGIHGRRLFAWAKTAGFAYQAALRAELTERLGVAWSDPVNGMAEIRGVPESVLEEFSTRRAEIEASLANSGHTTARAAQVATLATRPDKPEPIDPEIQRAEWVQRANSAGLQPETFEKVADRVRAVDAVTEARPNAHTDELTERRSYFDRRGVLQQVAGDHSAGIKPGQLAVAATDALTDGEVVRLGTEHPLAGPLYTTAELLRVEAQLLEGADRAAASGRGVCAQSHVETAIADRPSLSDEQQQMIRHVCSSPDGVIVVIGRAGTGKTYALDACRQAWAASGVTVIGAALAARTAAGLQADTGIPSTTVDQLLTDLARPGTQTTLPRRGVLVVDEAGMVGTRKLAALISAAERFATRVVLVGDPRQLPEIDAGGAFAALAQRGSVELTDNRRQVNTWERDALAQLRHGSVADAVSVYRDHGRITLAQTAEEARSRLVDDWWTSRDPADPDRTVMIALHQTDVDDLNNRARQHLQAAGGLQGPQLEVGSKAFATGDEVVALRNDRRIGITNGTRAQITRVEPDDRSLTVETREGRTVTLPGEYVDAGHVTHGYALTAHKAQGITVAHAFVLGSDRMYREAGYTSLSRAVERNDLYHVAPPTVAWQPSVDPHASLTANLSRSAAQSLATDHALSPEHANGQEHANGREHANAIRDAALADPGQHLVDRLGPPPPAGTQREMWAAAATAIEVYRERYDINSADCLGARPDREAEVEQGRAHEHADALAHQVELQHDLGLDNDLGLDR